MSGGGSGHEPFAAGTPILPIIQYWSFSNKLRNPVISCFQPVGFVGIGMASGAVAGFVFASPPVDSIYKAIRTLAKHNDSKDNSLILLLKPFLYWWIFAHPSHEIFKIMLCSSDAGVLIVLLNYTGDMLNFGLAAEKAKTHDILVILLTLMDNM